MENGQDAIDSGTPPVKVDGPIIIYQVVGKVKHYTDWASYLKIESGEVPKEGEIYKFKDPGSKKKEIDVTVIKYFVCVAACNAYQEMKTQEPSGKSKQKVAKNKNSKAAKKKTCKAAKKKEDGNKKTFKRQGKPYTTVRPEASPEATKAYLEYSAKESNFAEKRRELCKEFSSVMTDEMRDKITTQTAGSHVRVDESSPSTALVVASADNTERNMTRTPPGKKSFFNLNPLDPLQHCYSPSNALNLPNPVVSIGMKRPSRNTTPPTYTPSSSPAFKRSDLDRFFGLMEDIKDNQEQLREDIDTLMRSQEDIKNELRRNATRVDTLFERDFSTSSSNIFESSSIDASKTIDQPTNRETSTITTPLHVSTASSSSGIAVNRNDPPLLPHSLVLEDPQAYREAYRKKYSEKEPRRKLGNKLLIAFFSDVEVLSRNITGNPSKNIGILDVAKVRFLRHVIFQKFPAPEPQEVNEPKIWEDLVEVLDKYLRNARYELNRKLMQNVNNNNNKN